jgi:hypothetical protein
MLLAERSVPLFLAGRRLFEKPEPLLERAGIRSPRCGPRPFYDDPNHLARWLPLKIVSWADPILVGDGLGKRKLKLARDFGHTIDSNKD